MSGFLRLILHDMRFHTRQISEWVSLLLFFIIIIVLLPFAVGPDPEMLRRLAPGFIWIAALLMSLLALEKLFVQDGRDGTLDLMLLSPLPLPLLVFSKLMAQSLMLLLTLVIVAAPAALMLGMKLSVFYVLVEGLLLGVPSLVFLGGIMGAVTIAVSRNPAMLTLLLVPFYIPVLIFAVAACDAEAMGISAATPLLFLGSILAILVPASPFIIAAALRQTQG